MRLNDSQRLILRLACFLPLVAAPAATNWIFTLPLVEHRVARDFDPIADALRAGKTVWTTDDLRTLKATCIRRMPKAADVLVLGGSRSLALPEEVFRPAATFNASVLTGELDDMVAMFEVSLEAGKIPRSVVLELNPALSLRERQEGLTALDVPLHRALARYHLAAPLRQMQDLFSIARFRANVRQLSAPEWGISDTSFRDRNRIFPDGSGSFGQHNVDPSPDELHEIVRFNLEHLDRPSLHWRTTSQPTGFAIKVLRAFLSDLQSRGIQVIALFAPVHPVAYRFYRERGGYDETWLRRELASRKIAIVGSYSPAAVKAVEADFYDDVHPKPGLLERLFRESQLTPGHPR